jgi:hypothetical protein
MAMSVPEDALTAHVFWPTVAQPPRVPFALLKVSVSAILLDGGPILKSGTVTRSRFQGFQQVPTSAISRRNPMTAGNLSVQVVCRPLLSIRLKTRSAYRCRAERPNGSIHGAVRQ